MSRRVRPGRLGRDVQLGAGTVVGRFTNLYGCAIGEQTRIGPFVEIQRGVLVGARCKISSHTFLCSGVVVEDEVFIGHHVCFTNDRFPRATTESGRLRGPGDWVQESTLVRRGASIGSGSVILPGLELGAGSLIGAGSVVTRDVPPGAIVVGNPAEALGTRWPEGGW